MTWRQLQLSTVCTEVDRSEDVQPEATYQLLGMRSQIGGPFHRETKVGSEISATKLNKVRTGDFIYSRLFAWQGSFGVIPSELDGCYVSNEFPLFSIDETQLCSRFLTYWFGLRSTQLEVEQHCYGSTPGTRNRFKEIYFKQLMVPVPPLKVQSRIVSKLENVARLIDDRKKTLAAVDSDLGALLAKAFKVAIGGANSLPMEKVAPLVRRSVEVSPDHEYTEIGVRSFYKGIFKRRTLLGSEFNWQKLFWIKEGDIVFSNLMAWERGIGVASREIDGCVGNHRMLTCEVDTGVLTPGFLMAYFRSTEGFLQLLNLSPGSIARNKTLSSKRLPSVKVPVPPLKRQHWFDEIEANVNELRELRSQTRKDIDALLPSMLYELFGDVAQRVDHPMAAKSAEPTLRVAAG